MHHRVRDNAELLLTVTATPDTTLALGAGSRRSADAIGRLNEGHVGAGTVGARRAISPTEHFEVCVCVSLRGNFEAQCGYRRQLLMGIFSQSGVTLDP